MNVEQLSNEVETEMKDWIVKHPEFLWSEAND